ncbi:hypothetical protein J6590_062600 [Homalodisca vitripennis]|nr:hypothetical protein J6590_062600 [Homalodisca vitripennis]
MVFSQQFPSTKGELSFDQKEITCQPIDLHVSRPDTEVEEEKRKKFSIDSILGRHDPGDSRNADMVQSTLPMDAVMSSNSSVIHGEVRAEKPSLTQPEDKWLKGDFRTTTSGRAGGLLARTGSLSGHSSKQQPRSTLIWLSCDNHRTRYTAPLAIWGVVG